MKSKIYSEMSQAEKDLDDSNRRGFALQYDIGTLRNEEIAKLRDSNAELLAALSIAQGKIDRVVEILLRAGCSCDCDRDPCFACELSAVLGGDP